MSPRARILAWLAIQLALIAAWGYALTLGQVAMSLVLLVIFALRRMPKW